MKLSDSGTVEVVNAWIDQLLAANRVASVSVASRGLRRLPGFFSMRTLEAAKFVVVEKLPIPQLEDFGITESIEALPADSEGITFVDTFFVLHGNESNESLFFHELVHVVQWAALGRDRFIAMYLQRLRDHGYRRSLLEMMAYELQEGFDNQRAPFSVEAAVESELTRISI